MIVHHAAWVLPMSGPPIRDGWVAVERGGIVGLGGPDTPPPDGDVAEARETVAVLPGLVNAHTHLELSWMAGQVPPAASMPEWVRHLMSLRRSVERVPVDPIVEAIANARASGTALVGEITNTLASYGPLLDSPVSACVFREVLGFNAADPGCIVSSAAASLAGLTPAAWLRPSIVPHAPYSVSPGLMRAVADVSDGRPVSIHLAESLQEIEFLRTGTGAWRRLLEEFGAWNADWTPPGCSPVEYLERCGLLNRRLLVVHGVHLTDLELVQLADAGASVVTCPRSNRWTGAGEPPVARFYESGVRVAIGTDSLGSVDDLNMFREMAAVREAAPTVPAGRILESATRHGADALGFGNELGTIEPGKRAELIAVRIPRGLEDVEEYLVGGIQPSAIRWLAAE